MQRLTGWVTGVLKSGVLVVGVLAMAMPFVATAETVANMYQQSELVVGQGDAERRKATSEALATVLVRVAGQPSVLQSGSVKKALANPEELMEAYRYESGSAMLERDGQQVPATTLVLNFSRAGIEGLLRRAQLPLWPANRPSVLVWLVKDDLSEGRQLVSMQDQNNVELSSALKGEAKQRGLPVVMPLLDLEDQLSINPDALWDLDKDAIMQASERYQADAVLVGRYSQASSGQWLSTWTVFHKQHQQVFDRENAEEAALLSGAVDATSNYLAGIYSINTSRAAAGTVVMEVEQVQAFPAYVKTLSYLTELEVVRQLDLLSVDGTTVRLMLKMDGDVSSLTDALELDRRLVPVGPKVGSIPTSITPTPATTTLTPTPTPTPTPTVATDAETGVGAGLGSGMEIGAASGAAGLPATPGSSANPLRYRWPG